VHFLKGSVLGLFIINDQIKRGYIIILKDFYLILNSHFNVNFKLVSQCFFKFYSHMILGHSQNEIHLNVNILLNLC